MRETYVQQLIRVQRSVPVSRSSNWGWDDSTSCVNGLPYVCSINSPCDLFDQSRFGASEAKINLLDDRHGDKINYAGFGLDSDPQDDHEDRLDQAACR